MITEKDWDRILCAMGVRAETAVRWASAFEDEVQPEKFSAGMDDLKAWLPQILHECALLECLQENLNYSAQRLVQVWPTRFPTLEAATPFAHNPRALANKVYGGRMGNYQSDDGWNFIGRCPVMITGRAAYEHVGDLLGQDLVGLPGLIEQPHYALQASIAWWDDRIPPAMLSDQVQLRRRVNGGEIGLAHCEQLAALAQEAFA